MRCTPTHSSCTTHRFFFVQISFHRCCLADCCYTKYIDWFIVARHHNPSQLDASAGTRFILVLSFLIPFTSYSRRACFHFGGGGGSHLDKYMQIYSNIHQFASCPILIHTLSFAYLLRQSLPSPTQPDRQNLSCMPRIVLSLSAISVTWRWLRELPSA